MTLIDQTDNPEGISVAAEVQQRLGAAEEGGICKVPYLILMI